MRNYETKIYDYVDKKTGAHVVKASTMYAGKVVNAFAKCDPTDTFDLAFGTTVALKRLDIKIAEKRAASMAAYAKFCEMNIDFLQQEVRRVSKALERARVATGDRLVDAKLYEDELKELFKSKY